MVGVKYTAYDPWNTCCVNRDASLRCICRTVRLLFNTGGILCCVLTCWYLAVLTLWNTVLGDFIVENLTFMPCASAQRKHLTEDIPSSGWQSTLLSIPRMGSNFFVLHIIRSGWLSHSNSNPVDVALAARAWFWTNLRMRGTTPPLFYMSVGCAKLRTRMAFRPCYLSAFFISNINIACFYSSLSPARSLIWYICHLQLG